MQFKFDANQSFQVRAIESVIGLFLGQAPIELESSYSAFFSPLANRLDLDESRLLDNLQAVQERNKLPGDTALQCIEESVETETGPKSIRFCNFSVEMETGTGKTYVYLRTALELHRRYGMRKFIVVVPSVAVREGVLKTLKITESHLRALYDNVPYRHTVYDSKNITKVRQFAQSDCVEIMVMTIDSFNREENVIRQSTDRLQGNTPIHMLQAARPILILDEPQNMESELRIKALAALHPLFALRYSATHRNSYNLIYRLTPYEAYRQGLVKRIEVASVVKEDDFNQVFLRLDEIRSDKKTVTAKIAVHKRMAGGRIKEKTFTFRPGDKLEDKTARPEYASFQVEEIVPFEGLVRFTNGVTIRTGEARGADQEVIFREQIRYTVEEHFRKQAKLKPLGLKILTLFFLDRVENYTGETALVRRLFDEAFEEIKTRYPDWSRRKPEQARGAYFAQKKHRGGAVELIDSTTGQNVEDRVAFTLIMRDKERLLSFEEPMAFIFSHSALREGWDNPNVAQICTLNQTVSEVKKRQEIGRGMRLFVNQAGDRMFDEKVNVLTVVANESYERYVANLQTEMEEEFGREGAAPRPVNARQKQAARRRYEIEIKPEFRSLWDKIKQKTRYQVSIDREKLIAEVVVVLDKLKIDPPRVVVTRAAIEADKDSYEARQLSMTKPVANLAGRFPLPNLVEVMAGLMEHTTPPVRLSRSTLLEIIRRASNNQAVLDNPQEFAVKAVQIIKEKVANQLVYGIQYEKIEEWFQMEEWEVEIDSSADRMLPVERSIYDYIVCDSATERDFVKGLENLEAVRLYLKLPNWFKVKTPVGTYNPDWAIVMEDRDEFGDPAGKPLLYLVRETKSTTVSSALREAEQHKIHCGERHFKGALGVNYKVATCVEELL